MNPQQPIYELIQSMSASEKAYFKRFVTRKNKDKSQHYVRIFQAISRQKNYNEKKIIQQFKNLALVNNFSATKNYLYEITLESLRKQHRNKNDYIYLSKIRNRNILLHNKRLYSQALNMCIKGYKYAKQRSIKSFELIFLKCKLYLYKYTIPVNQLREKSDEIYHEILKTLREYENQLKLRCYHTHSEFLSASTAPIEDPAFPIVKKAIQELDETHCYNKENLITYYKIQYLLARIEKNEVQMKHWIKQQETIQS